MKNDQKTSILDAWCSWKMAFFHHFLRSSWQMIYITEYTTLHVKFLVCNALRSISKVQNKMLFTFQSRYWPFWHQNCTFWVFFKTICQFSAQFKGKSKACRKWQKPKIFNVWFFSKLFKLSLENIQNISINNF